MSHTHTKCTVSMKSQDKDDSGCTSGERCPARKPHLQVPDFYPPEGFGLGREDSKLCAFIEAPYRHLQHHKHQSPCAEHIW